MTLLIEDAARLWKDIPTESLHKAMEAAIVEAGSFPATNGLVAKLWASKRATHPVHDCQALGARDRLDEQKFLAAPDARLPTPEEQEANAAAAREIARRFGAH